MKQDRNGGYSLVEILLAIVLLGAIMVPTCTSLVMSIKINDRTDEMMQAQLAVSSAVETLMAEGITGAAEDYGWFTPEGESQQVDRFPEVTIKTEKVESEPYYIVTVTKSVEIENESRELASVTTYIRAGGGS